MKSIFPIIVIAFLFTACNDNDDNLADDNQNIIPSLSSDAIYNVTLIQDIIYAEGLSHQSINSSNASPISLKLDLYIPDNDSENRPVFMFIHGGGFTGGDKQSYPIGTLANYYASRGFVFASINYRLSDDLGTIPEVWQNYTTNLDPTLAPQYLAIYPAQRDAKAALRWIVANAATYKINTDYITVGGGSAGAITAITLGISNLEDFRDELDFTTDPTLITTNVSENYSVKTIVNFWGSKVALDSHEFVFHTNKFDSNDPALFTVHGTLDPTVPYTSATDLQSIYEITGAPFQLHTLEGYGHAAWNATVDGKPLSELSFNYVVSQQELVLE